MTTYFHPLLVHQKETGPLSLDAFRRQKVKGQRLAKRISCHSNLF